MKTPDWLTPIDELWTKKHGDDFLIFNKIGPYKTLDGQQTEPPKLWCAWTANWMTNFYHPYNLISRIQPQSDFSILAECRDVQLMFANRNNHHVEALAEITIDLRPGDAISIAQRQIIEQELASIRPVYEQFECAPPWALEQAGFIKRAFPWRDRQWGPPWVTRQLLRFFTVNQVIQWDAKTQQALFQEFNAGTNKWQVILFWLAIPEEALKLSDEQAKEMLESYAERHAVQIDLDYRL